MRINNENELLLKKFHKNIQNINIKGKPGKVK